MLLPCHRAASENSRSFQAVFSRLPLTSSPAALRVCRKSDSSETEEKTCVLTLVPRAHAQLSSSAAQSVHYCMTVCSRVNCTAHRPGETIRPSPDSVTCSSCKSRTGRPGRETRASQAVVVSSHRQQERRHFILIVIRQVHNIITQEKRHWLSHTHTAVS